VLLLPENSAQVSCLTSEASVSCNFPPKSQYKTTAPFSDGEGVSKDYFLSQRIEYTWIGAYTYCRLNGMRLAKLSTNRQFTHFRGLAVRYTKFPKIYMDIENSQDENEISCKVSAANIFPRSRVSKRYCETDKGAFVCEDFRANVTESGAKSEDPKAFDDGMKLIGEFSEF
jgi:hypothetical protein